VLITMGLASAHLGRKLRAWRAVLNLRRSWLSREVASVGLFLGAATLYTGQFPDDLRAGALTTLLGFLALFCADRVYSVLDRSGTLHLHSANLLWTGFFLTGIFAHHAWMAGLFGVVKLGSYIARRLRPRSAIGSRRVVLPALRIAAGFLVPLLLWTASPGPVWALAVLCVITGEWIDRAEFYEALERTSPSRSMAHALREAAAGLSAPTAGTHPGIPRS
jgi:DMSO reductase anchor subunit